MSTITKTIKVPIEPTKDQAKQIEKLMSEYQKACNYVSKYIFDNGFVLSFKELNAALYVTLRDKFSLGSQMTQSAIRDVIARYKAVKTQLKDEWVACGVTKTGKLKYTRKSLDFLQKPIRFQKPQICFQRDRDYCLKANTPKTRNLLSVKLSKDGRSEIKIKSCKRRDYPAILRGYKSLGTMRLQVIDGRWFALISVHEVVNDQCEPVFSVGIDRGLINLAVTYDEDGRVKFFKGNHVAKVRRKHQRLRARLQSKGTRGAKRRLRKLSGRENRWMTDVNHCVSKALVSEYGPGVLLVLEKLKGISKGKSGKGKDFDNQLNSWAFYQLGEFIKYKAQQLGISVIEVAPDYTSQRCPKCHLICDKNRDHARHHYHCSSCGYQSNDDRIAGMNLCDLGVEYITGDPTPKIKK